MTEHEILASFLEKIPAKYPTHMFCYFAENAARGNILPFTSGLLRAVGIVERASPGYANEMFERMGRIMGKGESQYEALLEIVAEIYVTAGLVEKAEQQGGKPLFAHEPGPKGKKNPEFEVCLSGRWCAIEVKTPRLISYGRQRSTNTLQVGVRLPKDIVTSMSEAMKTPTPTLPRDNPVKDFLSSAEAKFAVYETYRKDALRILIIVWDDFCNEPIAALMSPISGLLTPQTFVRDSNGDPVTYPHVDGVVVIRYQHQIMRATRCEPLIDGASEPLRYHHDGFPWKAFIEVPGRRQVPPEILEALNAVPLNPLLGAEYHPLETVMWIDVPRGGDSGATK